jgi:predicted transcriptional regulator
MTKLESILKEQGRSQSWLSKQSGIKLWRMHRIVKGIAEAKESEIVRISKRLNLPKETIFFNSSVTVIDNDNMFRKPSSSPQNKPGEE